MIVQIAEASPVPPFEQVRGQLATMIRAGVLPAGARLPSIRQLAADLSLAPATIARAYAELDRAGLVSGRGRSGTRVRARESEPVGDGTGSADEPDLIESAHSFAETARGRGATLSQAVEALCAAFTRLDATS